MSTRPRVLVFQHADYCPLAALADELAEDGITPAIVNFSAGDTIPSLEAFDALIVLGGSMHVWEEEAHPWLAAEKSAIRRWVRDFDRPYLGICLGHQLLANALGGKVEHAASPEAFIVEVPSGGDGKRPPIFDGFEDSFKALQWHGCEVTVLPEDATLLASTPGCRITAFTTGSAAYGIQYHPEVTVELVDDWCARPAVQELLKGVHGEDAVRIVHSDMVRDGRTLRENAARLYRNFMHIVRSRIPVASETE